MKIWRFHDPVNARYARAGRRGAWSSSSGGVCPECTASRQRRVQPLIMEWETGSNIVGDFVWPGFGFEVVVTDVAAQVLQEFPGFEVGPVEITAARKAGASSGRSNVPHEWPPLHELWVTRWVHLDPNRSTARLMSVCTNCNAEVWDIAGVERIVSEWDPPSSQLLRERRPRDAGAGIFVWANDLGVFRVHEFPGWTFCTDAVVEAVRGAELTNADFLEVGEATGED